MNCALVQDVGATRLTDPVRDGVSKICLMARAASRADMKLKYCFPEPE